MTTGENIRRKREEKDILQSELAQLVGVSKTHIYCIEKSKRKASLDTIVKIARVLRCPVDELIGDESA